MTSLVPLASRLSGRRIAVVGDVMLDHFLFGRVDRISPEAPVPVVRFDRDEYRLGGASNVARNVASLGGRVTLIGITGADEAGDRLAHEVEAAGFDAAGLVRDTSRPTTRKVRVVTARNQQVARIDYEQDAEAAGAVLQQLLQRVTAASRSAEAIILSDYRKGVVAPAVIEHAVSAARTAGVPLLVDPKVPRAERYRGASLLTPNHHEAELMAQIPIRTPDDARRAATIIHERSDASVLITWGEHGMWMLDTTQSPFEEAHLAASTREVADVTGAGDTVVAVLALGLAAEARLIEAAHLANVAAGLVVARFGPATVSSAELAAAAGPAER
jgi:D-beta-D-heptose 7-phosphate kinase/D-beta-D-heptose 1-phosphate adenosyltransferase